MKTTQLIASILILVSPLYSIGGSAPANTLNSGNVPTIAYSVSAFNTTMQTAITCLTALVSSVTYTSTSSVWACSTPAVTAIANLYIANYQVINGGLNAYASLLSAVNIKDTNYRRNYTNFVNIITARVNKPVVIGMYNMLLPQIIQINQTAGNLTGINQFIGQNFTFLVQQNLTFVQNTSTLQSRISNQNANNSQQAVLSFLNSSIVLTNNLLSQQQILNDQIAQTLQYSNNVNIWMNDYSLGAKLYLDFLLNDKINNMNKSVIKINNNRDALNSQADAYPHSMLNNTANIFNSWDSMLAANQTTINNAFTNTTSNLQALLSSSYALNGQMQAIQLSTPFLQSELNYAQSLFNWGISKTEYDIVNLQNYMVFLTTQFANILQQFDSCIIAENHFYNQFTAAPTNSFGLINAVYTLGTWTTDLAANFPGGLTSDQALRVSVYSYLIPYNSAFTSSSIVRINYFGNDMNFGYEFYLGYSISTLGVSCWVAVSDPILSSGDLTFSVEYAIPITGSLAVSQIGATTRGYANNINFSPLYVPTGF